MVSYLGRAIAKISDPPILTGNGKYAADITPPNTLHACFVRSKYARARIKSVSAEKALRVKGVRKIFTAEDFKDYPMFQPISPKPYKPYGAKEAIVYPLASKARFVGEPMAMVLAESKYAAAEAASLVEVDYEVLPAVVDPEEALKPDSPKVYEHWDSNLFIKLPSEWGDVDEAFSRADHIIRDSVKIQRFTGQALEPRAYVAYYDPLYGRLTFYASTQQPHPLRTILAETQGMPESQIKVVQPYVGGGFGLKIPALMRDVK